MLLSSALGYVYVRFGTSISNRAYLARNFVLIAMTTTLIIIVVKSSLALSLGLVGALSIVRFRTAIKEPEELAFLFLTIAIGLGLGADQRWITIIAAIIMMLMIVGRRFLFHRKADHQNLHLTISTQGPEKVSLDQILAILNAHCSAVNLKRLDDSKDMLEASFLVDFKDVGQLNLISGELTKVSKDVKVTFLDYPGAL
ncbi:MAG TPA: DUF4956 domain-containing protein [Methanocella sp.]|nr:DUF4956 domain-containing protein [Methanocella sp.]